MNLPGTTDESLLRFFGNIARILEKGYGIEQAEALVEAYALDYAQDFDGEDFDYLWFPWLHEGMRSGTPRRFWAASSSGQLTLSPGENP